MSNLTKPFVINPELVLSFWWLFVEAGSGGREEWVEEKMANSALRAKEKKPSERKQLNILGC